jgi:hypothetical protein
MDPLLASKIQHKEHREWLEKLNFYQDEIRIFQNELLLVLHKHADNLSLLEHVNEYREIFQRKLDLLDRFRHRIVRHEAQLVPRVGSGENDFVGHNELRQELAEFEQQFDELKQNFRRFVAHND